MEAQPQVLGTSHAAPSIQRREEVVATPPIQTPPMRMVVPMMVTGIEREWLMNCLSEFRKCNPWVFDGEKVDYWIVEKWVLHIEKLFHDTFVD